MYWQGMGHSNFIRDVAILRRLQINVVIVIIITIVIIVEQTGAWPAPTRGRPIGTATPVRYGPGSKPTEAGSLGGGSSCTSPGSGPGIAAAGTEPGPASRIPIVGCILPDQSTTFGVDIIILGISRGFVGGGG